MPEKASGPLAGLRVLEFQGIGPGPHCAMLLSDLGADVLRIGREEGNGWPNPIVDRGRASAVVDIRSPEGQAFCFDAIAHADIAIEGFRPGVMERLGFGPEECLSRNERLIYARMTGWGQDGPLAKVAGHDINYIALSGALDAIGRAGAPATIPLNLVGDFGGGSMFLAVGILAALLERQKSGKGQVVDAAIVDGVSSLMTFFAGLASSGSISLERDKNLLSGAAPFYRSYLCKDGREIAVGPLEAKFFGEFTEKLGFRCYNKMQNDSRFWKDLEKELERTFLQEDQAHWVELFDGSDACVAPVLTLAEAADHPHMSARNAYVMHEGVKQAAPAPRFSRTPAAIQPSGDGHAMLSRWMTDRCRY